MVYNGLLGTKRFTQIQRYYLMVENIDVCTPELLLQDILQHLHQHPGKY